MLEAITKLLWVLVVGAFAMGGWVTGIQLTVNSHASEIVELKDTTSRLDRTLSEDQKKIVEILGRMDERLKNIERHKEAL
jgi:hypothetical protein